MATFVPVFLTPAAGEVFTALLEETRRLEAKPPGDLGAVKAGLEPWAEANPAPPTSVSDVAARVHHVLEVRRIEHVRLGGDYDGSPSMAGSLEDVSCYPNLFAELLRRGYTEDDLARISRSNILRVMREAEDVAERLQKERPPSPARITELDT